MSAEKEPIGTQHEVLAYYKQKVQSLESQRQAWLAKLGECQTRMGQKQQKQKKLCDLRGEESKIQCNIAHYSVAKLDERLNSLNLDRQNQNLEFEEAQQLIKMQQLAEQYPVIAEKCLPCLALFGDQFIDNDLNLHNKSNNALKKYKKNNNEYESEQLQNGKKKTNKNNVGYERQKNVLKTGQDKGMSKKKTLEQIMRMQINETQKLNNIEIALLEEQQSILEQSIARLKKQRLRKSEGDRGTISEYERKYKELDKKHKDLAQKYFSLKRECKKQNAQFVDENARLKKTYVIFQDKVNAAMKSYQKDNKAKQALILRKSEDFQQDYKARMRAKQKNLQCLKQNYEKMQELCIEKARKLQATVQKAKYQLQDAQQKRRYLVQDSKEELKELQKRFNEQRIEKARIDLRLKQKMLQQKQRQQIQKEREEQETRQHQRDQLIKTAYKKTSLPTGKKTYHKEISASKGHRPRTQERKQAKRKVVNNEESSDEGDSLDNSALDNIRKQIDDLQNRIEIQERDAEEE